MNENQQELLDFIYQHNLSANDAARYVRDLDVPQEDKIAVMQDIQQREQKRLDLEQEERNRQELSRQQQLKEDIDRGLIDMRAARDKYEAASNALDETGMFDFLAMETNAWLRLASPQRQFEAAKAAQAKAATELQAKFYEAGREDLAGQLGLPKSKWSRRVYTKTQATANGMLFDFAASISDNEWVEQQEKLYGDISRGISMETQKTAGELVKDMGSALLDLDLAQYVELIPDLAEEGSIMLAEQAPYLALTFVPYAGIPLNLAARASQAYQDIEDDPNLTGQQKAVHSFLSGGIESIGDLLIGRAGGLGAGIAAKAVTPIASKLMSNALVRGTVKTGGVILAEGTSETIQEGLIMASEKYVLGREEENVVNRLYESFVGGALVGGPLTGVRSFTSPTPAQLASRPGDPTHPLATEIAEKIDSIIEQSENVEPNSPQAKALEIQLEDLLQQEADRVGKSRDYYRKMRRRDRESYDRIIELDSEIGRAIIRSKSLNTDWGKDTAKKEIEALMEERNKLYKGFDEKGLAPMTSLEMFEDAVEDIDNTIADIDADLESIEGLEPQNDDDLKLVNDLMTHKSALRNKKRALQKALGDLQAAENTGDTDAVAEAYRALEVAIDQKPPRLEATTEQTNDDIEQDQSAPQQEPTQQEVETEAKPKQRVDRQPLTFSKEDNITDDEIAQLPTQLIKPIRNLLKGLKLPVTVKIHDTLDDLRAAHPRKSTKSKAFYNPKTKEINLHKGSAVADVRHEFIHAMLHDMLGNSKYRKQMLREVSDIWGSKNVLEVRRRYEDYPERLQDEEVITAFMEQFATQDGLNRLRKRGLIQRLKDFFNDIFNKKYGRYADQYFINTDSDLLAVMEAFVAGSEVGSEINVAEQAEADAQTSAMDNRSRAYPDLQNKLVTFKVVYPNRWGEFTGTPQEKTVRIKDYWHWRNYWAQQTGNGRHDWIYDVTYKGDDGSVKKINNPNPKKDPDGNVIEMEPKLFSFTQKEIRSSLAYQTAIDGIYGELNTLLNREARYGLDKIPMDQADLDRIEELRGAMRDLNQLRSRKEPVAKKYEDIRERVMGPRPAPKEKGLIDPKYIGTPRGTSFLQSLRPDNATTFFKGLRPDTNASTSDDVGEGFVLDSIDSSEGAPLEEMWSEAGIKTKRLDPHKGKEALIWQYDKTDVSSGPGYDTKNAVSSHATESQAREMIAMLERAAKKQALKEKSSNVTVIGLISVQSDSVLSNPRAIDDIADHYNSLSEDQKKMFLEKFGEVFSKKLTSGLFSDPEGKLRSRESGPGRSSKVLLNLIDKVYGGHTSAGTIKKRTGVMALSENFGETTVAFPDFSRIALSENRDALFLELIEGMKGMSIRGNNEIITAMFSSSKDSAGKEFGRTTSDIKSSLEAEGLTNVPTADIVGFVEIPMRVSNWDKPNLARVETALDIETIDAPFDKALISGDGTEFFGLPKSIPYDMVAGDVTVASIAKKLNLDSITMSEAQALIDDESKLMEAVPVIRYPNKRGIQNQEWIRYSDAISKLESLNKDLKGAEEAGSSTTYTKISAEIMGLENALKTHAKKIKDLQSESKGISQSLRMARQAIQITTIPVDPTDQVSLDDTADTAEIALDSVQNNTWAPRDRSALQQKFDWFRLKFQDKFAPVMMMQEDVERARGSRVEGDQNFKRAEELMYGKAHNDLEKLETKVESLKKSMVDGKVDSGMLTDFMYARHAAERNAMLKDRDGVENGSGISDQEAAEIMASFTPEQVASLEKSAAIVDEISQDTRDTMRKFGLESDVRIDSFERMFKHYVPLGGLATDSKDVDNYPYPTGGIGFHVKGSTTKKAKGRKTMAENIVAQVIQQNGAVKIKARRNEALQSLFNLVKENPNTNLWNTSDNIPVNDPDRAVGVRINGEQKFIIFKDASLAKNLKGMGVQKLDGLSRLMAAPANFLRAAFTTRNPEFIISNFSRDILSAIPNAIAEADLPDGAIKDKHAVARKIITRTPQTLKALLKSDVLGKELDPVIAKYLSEFKEDGGQTGWGFIKPLQEIAEDLNNETSEKNKARKAIKWMEKNSLAHIENVNDAFENSIRLSAYVEAREAGVERADAAQLAKNITVNFNKSGEFGAVANAYYLFFNASIQGSTRIVRSLSTLKQVQNPDGTISKQLSGPQRIVIGLGLASGMLAMINMALSDEDEDGVLFYNKIPDYEKERNLIMMYDGKNYIKIPLPYGYNLFSNMGTALAETMAGQRDADEAMWFVLNSAFSSFSPISFGQSENFAKYLAKGVAPTTLKPLVEIAVNETYFGSKVHQEQFPVGAKRPDSELAFRSPRVIKQFFQWMNSATGGSEMVSGSVDLNPDLFWYPFEYYIGGLGQFGFRTFETAYSIEEMIRNGEKVKLEANDIPFLRKVYGEPSKYYDFDLYDSNKEQVLQLYKERKEADVKNIDRYNGIVKLDKKIKSVEKKLKVLRKERRAAQDLPFVQRVNKSAELQEKERILIMEYNALHEKLRGQ